MILLFLLLSVVLLSSLTHAKVRRDKPSASGGNADDDDLSLRNRKQPLLVAETTLQLQTRQLSLRATLERDAQGRESRLRVSAELNHFADDMYLALGFNAQGRMSPSLALVGEFVVCARRPSRPTVCTGHSLLAGNALCYRCCASDHTLRCVFYWLCVCVLCARLLRCKQCESGGRPTLHKRAQPGNSHRLCA